jgi:hypothetical protein
MPKKNTTKATKVSQLKQTHAKVESPKPTMLDQIWGFNEMGRYGTVDEGEYGARLRDMTRADLENHAKAVGCLVLEDSARLRDALMKQFNAYILSLRKPTAAIAKTGKITEETKRVLNEGR